jgi:hypothetical protein
MSSMPHFVPYGNVEVSTKTEIGKHLWANERKPDYDPRNHPYPKMMYKAFKGEDGVVRCMDSEPKPFLYPNQEMYRMACERVSNFNLTCQRTVGLVPDNGPAEQRAAEEEGWRSTPREAMDFVFSLENAITKAASERAYQDRNMSEKARAEVAAAEAETSDQVPEVKEKPAVKKVHWKTAQKAQKAAEAKVS